MTETPPRAPRRLVLPLHGAVDDREAEYDAAGSVFFIGTATTLIRYRGITVLTDPNFLHRGERVRLGYGLRATRLTEPAIGIHDLPDVDLVLLSHLSEDHFDRVAAAELDRGLPIVSTRHATTLLSRQGFRATTSLATWQSLVVEKGGARVTVTAMPARHGPPLVSSLLPPTMGSMLDFETTTGGRFRIWVSGDTLVHDHLREIPLRYPDVDLALLHLGGARLLGILVTMDGQQGTEAIRIVNPRTVVPIHYDDYTAFRAPLDAFHREVDAAGLGGRVHYLARGETYTFRPDRTQHVTAPPAAKSPTGSLPHPAKVPSAPRTDELSR